MLVNAIDHLWMNLGLDANKPIYISCYLYPSTVDIYRAIKIIHIMPAREKK